MEGSERTKYNEEKDSKDVEKVNLEGREYRVIREGKAAVLFEGSDVFYNPVQYFNRDLSCLVATVFSGMISTERAKKAGKKGHYLFSPLSSILYMFVGVDRKATMTEKETEQATPSSTASPTGITILEALAASGLRSIRYYLEVPRVRSAGRRRHSANCSTLVGSGAVLSWRTTSIPTQSRAYGATSPSTRLTRRRSPLTRATRCLSSVLLRVSEQEHKSSSLSCALGVLLVLRIQSTCSLRSPSTLPPSHRLRSSLFMHNARASKQRFDLIDLDPYGTAAPFLDSTVQAAADGGLRPCSPLLPPSLSLFPRFSPRLLSPRFNLYPPA